MATPSFSVSNGKIPPLNLNGVNALARTTVSSTTAATKTKKVSYRYPLAMLDDKSDYLQIKVLQFKSPGFPIERFQTAPVNFRLPEVSDTQKTLLNTIYLPIPSGISDSNAVSWGEGTINPIEGFGLGASEDIIKQGISGIVNSFQSAMTAGSSLLKDANAQKAMQRYFEGAAVQAAGGNVTGLGVLTRTTGAVLNNNQELLFQGPSLRSFSFTFDLSPRNSTEAEEVKQIIRIFKKAMAAKRNGPTSVQGLFIGPPDVFEISYKSGKNPHKFLNKFKQCALTNIQMNYTASGAYSTYYDGTPVHMQMTLDFQELNPIYAEDYDTQIGLGGVGY